MRASSHTAHTARPHAESHLVALEPLDLSRQASLLDGRIVGVWVDGWMQGALESGGRVAREVNDAA